MTGEILRITVNQLFSTIKVRSTGAELVFVCPEPGCGDTTGNRSVNLKTGKTNCWRCNKGGDFVRWARRLGYALEDNKPVATPIDKIDTSPYVPLKDPLPPVLETRLPEGFIPCVEWPNSIYTRLIAEMAVAKNLTIEDFYEAGVGFTRINPRWEPYAIFPVKEYNRVVYYQGRTYVDPDEGPTKLFPSRNEIVHGARYWVYNIDEIKQAKPKIVIVVESILNVLSLRLHLRALGIGDTVVVGVFKHYVSRPQAQKILAHDGIQELCLLYDHDASQASWDKASFLSDKVQISIAEMPLGPGGQRTDPNDDAQLAYEAFRRRRRYSQESAVLRKIERIEWRKHRASGPPSPEKTLDPLSLAEQLADLAIPRRRGLNEDS